MATLEKQVNKAKNAKPRWQLDFTKSSGGKYLILIPQYLSKAHFFSSVIPTVISFACFNTRFAFHLISPQPFLKGVFTFFDVEHMINHPVSNVPS